MGSMVTAVFELEWNATWFLAAKGYRGVCVCVCVCVPIVVWYYNRTGALTKVHAYAYTQVKRTAYTRG